MYITKMKRTVAVILAIIMMASVLMPVAQASEPGGGTGTVSQDPADTGGDDAGGDGTGTGGDAAGGDDTTDYEEPGSENTDEDDELDDLLFASMLSGDGFPYYLGWPDEYGNDASWEFYDGGLDIEYLKEAKYLVLEVSKRPDGWMAVAVQSDYRLSENPDEGWKWYEKYIELGDFGEENNERDNIWDVYDIERKSIVIPLDTVQYRYDPDDEWHSYDEIISSDAQEARLTIRYHLWQHISGVEDPWEVQTGFADLGLVSAYLTDDYGYSFGEPEPARREYNAWDDPRRDDIVGFRVEAIGHDYGRDYGCGGNVEIIRSDRENEHGPMDNMYFGWDEYSFIERGGKTYLEFDFRDWRFFDDENATRGDIAIFCNCKGASFGDIEYFYEQLPFPADIDSSHPAYDAVVSLKNLGFYQDRWSAQSYVFPEGKITRWDFKDFIFRITGGWQTALEYWYSQMGNLESYDGDYIYGFVGTDWYWEDIARIIYSVENGYMKLLSGRGWVHELRQEVDYTNWYRPHDWLRRGDLYYGAAAIAGLEPAGEGDAQAKLYSTGIIGTDSEDLDYDVRRGETYIVLAAAVRYTARNEKYSLNDRDWLNYDLRWTTSGMEHEGPVDVPVAAFRQYNSLVLELSDEPPADKGIEFGLEQSWGLHRWDRRWYDMAEAYRYDTAAGKHLLVFYYEDMIDWHTDQTVAIFHVNYECCRVEGGHWRPVDPEDPDGDWHEYHQPGCPGTWELLGVERAYLANTEPPVYPEKTFDAMDGNPGWREILGFKVEVTGSPSRVDGEFQIRRSDNENDDLWAHWNQDWIITREDGKRYLEFDWDGWTFFDEWSCDNQPATRADIRISAGSTAIVFGDIIPVYDLPEFPSDMDGGHPAFDASIYMKNLGFYETMGGANRRAFPDMIMNRFDFIHTLARIGGGSHDLFMWYYFDYHEEPDGNNNAFGDIYRWDYWMLGRVLYALDKGFMQLKDGAFRPWDALTRGELYFAAAVLAGYNPGSQAHAQTLLHGSGIINNAGENLGDAINRSEIYNVLYGAVRSLAPEDGTYELPAPFIDTQNASRFTWGTTGYEYEDWFTQQTQLVPVAVFRQYNSLVLELGGNPPGRNLNFIHDSRNGWADYGLSWGDVYDEETNMLIFHYGSLNLNYGGNESVTKYHISYDCCQYNWEEIEHDGWTEYYQVHEPGCPGGWAALGVTRAYLTNTEPPPPPPVEWSLDPHNWDGEYGSPDNQKYWSLGSFGRMRGLQVLTLTFGENTSIKPGERIQFINNAETWSGDGNWNVYSYTITAQDVINRRITVNLEEWHDEDHDGQDDYKIWAIRDDLSRSGYKFGIGYWGNDGEGYEDLDLAGIHWAQNFWERGFTVWNHDLQQDITYDDRYYMGNTDWLNFFYNTEDGQWEGDGDTKGWSLGRAQLGLFRFSENLVIELERFESGFMWLILNYEDEHGEWQWEGTQLDYTNCTLANYGHEVRIDLSQMNGISGAKTSDAVNIIIGHNWREFNIWRAYLHGDFTGNFLDQYDVPIVSNGFAPGDFGNFYTQEWDGVIMTSVPMDTPDGDGYAAKIEDRIWDWQGLELDPRNLLKRGETYYIEAWVMHNEPEDQPFFVELCYNNDNAITAAGSVPGGEWMKISGMFTVKESGSTLYSLRIRTWGEEYEREPGQWFAVNAFNFYIDRVTIWGPEPPPPPQEYNLPGPGFDGPDKFYIGNYNFEWSWGDIAGWNFERNMKELFGKAGYLYLEFDSVPDSDIEFAYNYPDPEIFLPEHGWGEEGWGHEWVTVYSYGDTLLDGNILRIDLRAAPNYYRMMASNSYAEFIIGPDWRFYGVMSAWLEGDFMSLTDSYIILHETGFEDDEHLFGPNGGASIARTNIEKHTGGWSLQVTDRVSNWDGAALDVSGIMRRNSLYYISAWVMQKDLPEADIIATLQFDGSDGMHWQNIAAAACPQGEWVRLEGLFIVADISGISTLYFELPGDGDSGIDFFIDDVMLMGPYIPPPPNMLYPVRTSIKDVYKNSFDVAVISGDALEGLEGNDLDIALRHISQHYSAAYANKTTAGTNREITLGAGSDPAALAAGLTGSGLVVLLTIEESAAAAQVSELMVLLLEKAGSINRVVIGSLFDLFDYTDGITGSRYRFIPNEAYSALITAPLAANAYTGTNVIINQVYGSGPLDNTGSVSHSFVELYNPTASPVSLYGWSLQIQNGNERVNSANYVPATQWAVYTFTPGDIIEPFSSYLIRLDEAAPTNSRLKITNADIDWTNIWGNGVPMSNRAYSVALVSDTTRLPQVVADKTAAGVVDWVGAANTPTGTTPDEPLNGNGTPVRVSKQVAARRIVFGKYDGSDDAGNYEEIDYRTANTDMYRPRWSGDGVWGRDASAVPDGVSLTFSADAGIYGSNFALTLAKNGDNGAGIIWYTLDGSDPVPYSGGAMRYDGTITVRDRSNDPNYFADISLEGETYAAWGYQGHTPPDGPVFKGTVVRAQVYDIYGNALTKAITNTYLINPPAEFSDMPIISISANEYDLFDPEDGIFMPINSVEKGADFERLTYFEFFESETGYAREVAQNLGMRIHGGWSRGNAQKSMRFYASSSRDPDNPSVDFDIFNGAAKDINGNPITTFRRFLLRNFGNDGGGFALMRDNMNQEAARGLNMATQDYRYAVVMLNGEFWGLYELRERIDEYMVASKFGLPASDIVVFENPHPERGAAEDEALEYPDDHELYMQMGQWFMDNPDLSDPELYEEAQRYIDIGSLIDMYIIESYSANFDWPNNNTRAWRYRTDDYPEAGTPLDYTDGRWRWILNDMDGTFAIYNSDDVWLDYFEALLDPDGGYSSYTLFWRTLLTNADFRERFINRFMDIMNFNYRPEQIEGIISKLVDIISPVYVLQRERWNTWGNYNFWLDEQVQRIRNFNAARAGNVLNHITNWPQFGVTDAQSVLLSVVKNDTPGYLILNGFGILPGTPGVTDRTHWTGTYLTGLTQTITAVPEEGYAVDRFIVSVGDSVADTGYTVTGNTLTIVLTGDTTVEAVYKFDIDSLPKEIAEFTLPMGTSGTTIDATSGMWKNRSGLEFYYANGTRAALGHATREPVNCPNNAGRWYPAAGTINANNSAGWVITTSTFGYENLVFSADQGSSNSGPRDFRMAYRLSPSDTWTEIPGSDVMITSDGDTIGNTYNFFELPAALENLEFVQIKVYISSSASRSGGTLDAAGGNTSINNIRLWTMNGWTPLTVTFDITGAGTVTTNKPYYEEGETVILTVTPGGGWRYADGTLKANNVAVDSNRFIMPAGGAGVEAQFTMINPAIPDSNIIIRQAAAAGAGVSHGFVELYNKSASDISLNGLSLQIANTTSNNSPTGAWSVLPLQGTIKAGGSYLIVAGNIGLETFESSTARYVLPYGGWDCNWGTITISNRGFTIALVNGTAALSNIMPDSEWANIIDIVGAHNATETIHNYLGTGTVRVSGSEAIRRVNLTGTGDNSLDYESVRYAAGGIDDTELEAKKPQRGAFIAGDANRDGRVTGTDVQTIILWINSSYSIGNLDIGAAKVTAGSDPRPDIFDVLALINWVNSGADPQAGYTNP